jgi:hypothetical protein
MANRRKFKPIKQKEHEETCLGCVMAMATHTTIKDVKRIIGDKPVYSDKDLITYLLHYGYYLGSGFNTNNITLKKNSKLTTTFKLKNNPAYIVVESERDEDCYHAIYWDGKQLYDPNPFNDHNLPFSHYSVIEIYPIRKFTPPDNDGILP